MLATFAIGTGILLSACERSQGPIGDGVVVAKVNSDEITLGRLKAAMNRAALGEPGQVSAQPDAAMDALVRQSLAAEQARKLNLDEAPAVHLAIEEARRDILANAYFEHLAARAGKPGDSDIHAYFVAHPELFRDRRLYSLKEIALPQGAIPKGAIAEAIKHAKNVDEIARQLRHRGIEFQVTSSIRAPESLPIEMLSELGGARLGDIVTYYGNGVGYVAQVIAILNAPISESAAHDKIAKYLENQRTKALLDEEDKRLRADARIEIGPDLKKLFEQPAGSNSTVTMDAPSLPENLASHLSASTRMSIIQ